MKIQKILVATDYGPVSQYALAFATSLARDTRAALLISHVSELEPYPVGEPAEGAPTVHPGELEKLHAVVPSDSRVEYTHHLLHGEPGSADIPQPADILVKFAADQGVDLIVLGTHGRTGLGHFLMGSVAESVVRRAGCPVVTVKGSE